jgi:four helix bundle protein
MMENYKDLRVWQKAIDLVVTVYQLTKKFPQEERYALTSQIQRAVTSIPANIAEGWGRASTKEYIYHLTVARGSLMELETHLNSSSENQLYKLNNTSTDTTGNRNNSENVERFDSKSEKQGLEVRSSEFGVGSS